MLDNIFNELIESGATPGVSYLVSKDAEIFSNTLGYKTKYVLENNQIVEKEELADSNTLYDIASLTKIVCTNTIIFRMIDQKKIKLTDNVKKYLPDFKHEDITIYDLLNHISGLVSDFSSKDIITKEAALEKLYASTREIKEFNYSCIGYMFLGLIIEKVYQKSLDEVFDVEVKVPLEMNNTCFNPKFKDNIAATEVTLNRGLVKGVVHDEKACSLNGVAGNAGLFSNTSDLYNFASMILNKGMFNGKRYLSEELIDMWLTKQTFNSKNNTDRSCTWVIGNNPNVILGNAQTLSFSGFTGPSISIDLLNKVIIIMLTNRIHPSRDNRRNILMRASISRKIYNCLKVDMLHLNKVFSSKNIDFVNLSESLIREYLEMINDPEISCYVSRNPKNYSFADEKKWVNDKLNTNALCFSMMLKDTNDYIGNIELMDVDNSVELGIVITKDQQDKHLGTEAIETILNYAFNHLKLTQVNLKVFKNNLRAIHCYQKLGFEVTNELPDEIFMVKKLN